MVWFVTRRNPGRPESLRPRGGFIGFLKQLRVPLPGLLGWIVILLESVGALLAAALALVFTGPGRIALDPILGP